MCYGKPGEWDGHFFRGEVEEMVKGGEAKIRGAENGTGEDQRRRKQDMNGIVERDMSTLQHRRVLWFESRRRLEKKDNMINRDFSKSTVVLEFIQSSIDLHVTF
ncbi:hypothetical protein EAF00_003435 [Botryotinia globosa]|nr:hypothetical protein EAF00_003435 [Botryotinia globosa]